MRKIRGILTILVCFFIPSSFIPAAEAQEKTVSQQYVEDMGSGWNLGNTFDSFDERHDRGEETWGNPKVTKELIQAVKEKEFDSIRLPLTLHQRIGSLEEQAKINEELLNRYEEVVQWALEEDLYVMINIHHDSWTWLADWDGESHSEEYLTFVFIWNQLAERFKEYDHRLSFEAVNEPDFHTSEENKIEYLTRLNDAFYQTIRQSGGNNSERMLILPTVYTDTEQKKMDALYDQIVAWEDDYIIATVHYYGEWVYSTNIGKTRFDGVLWDDVTPRSSLVEVFDRVAQTFTEEGIGVVVGEYGLLGYDKSDTTNQLGETLKYIEFINHYAREKGLALMLWDNGQHLNRHSFSWNTPRFGEMIEQSMDGRSAYSKGLDTYYIHIDEIGQAITIPLLLNDLKLESIYLEGRKLVVGDEYTYKDETVTLTGGLLEEKIKESNQIVGKSLPLRLHFSDGADWDMQLIYVDTLVLKEATGLTGRPFLIPTDFNGHHIDHVQSKDEQGTNVLAHDWWDFLEYDVEFTPLYDEGRIQLSSDYTALLEEGTYELIFTLFNGEEYGYRLIVDGGRIRGIGSQDEEGNQYKAAQRSLKRGTREQSSSKTLWLLAVIGLLLVAIGIGYEMVQGRPERK
ncbi:cellulase family glycosylhydrolase [Alkalibacterium iburiense]|uniref:Cellulase family glycosylhydrolase n=1 Tax=Alkalibacterium iburiense TaxID=290589 RepID=A0ABN0X302_9LACT